MKCVCHSLLVELWISWAPCLRFGARVPSNTYKPRNAEPGSAVPQTFNILSARLQSQEPKAIRLIIGVAHSSGRQLLPKVFCCSDSAWTPVHTLTPWLKSNKFWYRRRWPIQNHNSLHMCCSNRRLTSIRTTTNNNLLKFSWLHYILPRCSPPTNLPICNMAPHAIGFHTWVTLSR